MGLRLRAEAAEQRHLPPHHDAVQTTSVLRAHRPIIAFTLSLARPGLCGGLLRREAVLPEPVAVRGARLVPEGFAGRDAGAGRGVSRGRGDAAARAGAHGRRQHAVHGLDAVRRAQDGQGEGALASPLRLQRTKSTPTYSASFAHACASKTRGGSLGLRTYSMTPGATRLSKLVGCTLSRSVFLL